ncbi:sodium ion-translocating decarboxylase subunit beta [Anaerocolumna sp. MB42-C2]|uniref:sodium ion-translocating decarboxylase subunit beta n=1 Tax=Anaerocolumna sp. MB42-C2 TaxID=3070997 RepID=UPI0027DEF595|nr:sodium ion-translocating decarboxylase subunit beta [Anaerocolumna sp. MB42-C2]WMJ87177.1 sodium ion-translocating decarboxylase subunit beta [Anaerocolumna sp. MB42-C2]
MYLKRKIVVIITVLSILISLLQAVFKFLRPIYLSHKYDFDIGDASSIGIIGGADGPTAIYIASSQSGYFLAYLPAIISIIGIIYLIKTNKK